MPNPTNSPAGYQFTKAHPPLLRNDDDIRSIPAASLEQRVGTTGWLSTYDYTVDETEIPGITQQHDLRCHVYAILNATRTLRWQLVGTINTYAEDTTIDVKTETGYSASEKSTFENTISDTTGVDVHIYFLGFSDSAKQTLGITSQTEVNWHETKTIDVQTVFKGGFKYANWVLVDIIRLTGIAWHTEVHWDGVLRVKYQQQIDQSVSCILDNYADKGAVPSLSNYSHLLKRVVLGIKLDAESDINPPSGSPTPAPITHPCTICDCKDFIELDGRVDCARDGCGHSVFDHN